MKRPLIGVTGPSAGGWPAWVCTWLAVRCAGGRARHITVRRPCQVHELDGLILGGGADVDPKLYGEHRHGDLLAGARDRRRPLWWRLLGALFFPLVYLVRRISSTEYDRRESKERDALETRLLEEASARNLPVLGICRGMQLLNVTRGGSLHQQVAGFYTETPSLYTIWPRKNVDVSARSRLAEVMRLGCRHPDAQTTFVDAPDEASGNGSCRVQVNALHKQGVNRTGTDLRVVAKDKAGVVQALEDPQRNFVIGVQWHPEFLPFETDQRALFRALIAEARNLP